MFEALVRGRRSVRDFTDEAPSEAQIEALLSMAIAAPSASNKQPWRFLVVRTPETIAAMGDAVRGVTDRIAAHVPEASRAAFEAYGSYFTRFEHAPVVVVPIHRGHRVLSHLVDDLDAARVETIARMERDSGLVGVSLALMNLLLGAHDAGLGASAMTGPLVAEPELRAILKVPTSWGIVALVPIGVAASTPSPTARKDLAKVVRWL